MGSDALFFDIAGAPAAPVDTVCDGGGNPAAAASAAPVKHQ